MKLLGDFSDFDFSDFSGQDFNFDVPSFESFDDFGYLNFSEFEMPEIPSFDDFSEFEMPEIITEPEEITMDDFNDAEWDYFLDEPEATSDDIYIDEFDDEDWDYFLDETEPVITGESPQIWEGSSNPPPVQNNGDQGIDVTKILQTAGSVIGAVAGEYFKYQRTIGPNGQPIYTPQRIPNPPPGTRYDASGRLVYVATGQPVRVDTYGRVVDSSGRVVSTSGTQYDTYGRPITTSAGFMQNIPQYAIPLGIAALATLIAFSGGNKK